jgi:hypothetical protein
MKAGLDGPLATYPDTVELRMGDVINLRTMRKQARRQQADKAAAANRLAFGRTKADRTRAQVEDDKAQRTLEHHRIETGDGQ